jgi:hydrogenase maturation protease
VKKIKVLGIGSPIGDDQAGWVVVSKLQSEFFNHTHINQIVTFTCCDRPGPGLIELMRDSDCVYLVDAIKTGSTAGAIHRLVNNEIFELRNTLSTHDIGVAQALQIAAALNSLPPTVILFGVEVDKINLFTQLSEPVKRGVDMVVKQVKEEIFAWHLTWFVNTREMPPLV